MNFIYTMVLALAMSTDAFAASVGKGAALQNLRISEALRTGIIFGVIEAITPLIGWGLGSIAAEFVADWDHWIAFGLLLGLGSLMIRNGLRAEKAEATPVVRHSFWLLAATGFATSIDAMAVGVSLAFIDQHPDNVSGHRPNDAFNGNAGRHDWPLGWQSRRKTSGNPRGVGANGRRRHNSV